MPADWKKRKAEWASKNPEPDTKLDYFYAGNVPEIDYKAIQQKEGSATRAASAQCLVFLPPRLRI